MAPLKKDQKKKRDSVNVLCNRLLSAFNFKQIRTWRDVYKMQGMTDVAIASSPELSSKQSSTLDRSELKNYCDNLKKELEELLSLQKDLPPVTEKTVVKTAPPVLKIITPVPEPTVAPPPEVILTPKDATNDYGLEPSDKEKAFLYWFQKKACSEMLDKVFEKDE